MYTRCSYVVFVCLLFSLTGTAAAQSDGADIQIRDGTIVATAADYEMDGTMWAAFTLLEDTSLRVHRTTDHGLNWGFFLSLRTAGIADRLGLVVGEGESAFVYLFYLNPAQDGDLQCLRFDRETGAGNIFDVAVGPDTIRDFAVCRDYTGSNYWLYAVVTNSDLPSGGEPVRFLRSASYGVNWEHAGSFGWRLGDPHLSAGAGSHIYLAARFADTLWRGVNTLYLDSLSWYLHWDKLQDGIQDPAIGAAFTMPESAATVWCLWSQNYQNSGDWDIKYSYMAGISQGWSAPAYLAGSTQADEQYPDVRNYTSLGNQYINASYISDDDICRCVYRRYAHAATPEQWSDTLRINQGSAGTGSEIRPKLCYTPGGPFSGAGCVFVGAGLNGCWWNAPYPTGVESPEKAVAAIRLEVRPSVGRGPFRVFCQEPTADLTVHDRAGRLVRTLALDPAGVATWDGIDDRGQQLAHGVYFCRFVAGDYRATEKVVLQK